MEEPSQKIKVDEYITLLDVVPEKKIDRYFAILSAEQVTSLSEKLKGHDLNKVAELIQAKFKTETDKQKIEALKPMTAEEREAMKITTRGIADRFMKIQSNLEQVIQASQPQAVDVIKPALFTSLKNLSVRIKNKSKSSQDTNQRRGSSAGPFLFK